MTLKSFFQNRQLLCNAAGIYEMRCYFAFLQHIKMKYAAFGNWQDVFMAKLFMVVIIAAE
jgi:hypothetical protein